MTDYLRQGYPLPVPTALTEPFWEGCRRGELRVPCCRACGKRFFTPYPACQSCLSTNWAWEISPGTGLLYSFSVVHRPARPAIPVPYVLATVDLDDGWSMMTNIIDCSAEELRCDLPVKVRFVARSAEIVMPCFAPA